jgi:hypothetical protein
VGSGTDCPTPPTFGVGHGLNSQKVQKMGVLNFEKNVKPLTYSESRDKILFNDIKHVPGE